MGAVPFVYPEVSTHLYHHSKQTIDQTLAVLRMDCARYILKNGVKFLILFPRGGRHFNKVFCFEQI